MLTHLQLENFKIWSSTDPMRLAPMMLRLAINYFGKSSLTQSLLLIRQTFKGNDYPSETFRGLKNGELREYGEYRTQRLVQAAWDQLSAGVLK